MIVPGTVYQLHCDECRVAFTWEEFETIAIWNSVAEIEAYIREWWTSEYASTEGWSTDGEGKVHCAAHDALTVTQAARDELARIPGRNDVPLIEASEVTA